MNEVKTKYCKHCGQTIPEDAVICTHCGRQVEAIGGKDQPIIINNSASASAAATAPGKTKKKYSKILDLILIICTGGLWLIVMALRPKYE